MERNEKYICGYFRKSFLKREGTLTFDEKNWKLNVESNPIDVLLKKLPWGISLIKFHWIDYIILWNGQQRTK